MAEVEPEGRKVLSDGRPLGACFGLALGICGCLLSEGTRDLGTKEGMKDVSAIGTGLPLYDSCGDGRGPSEFPLGKPVGASERINVTGNDDVLPSEL